MNQITQLRLPDGRQVAFVDWQDTPLHSTIDLVNNFTDPQLECFTYTTGDLVPATANAAARRQATPEDTNVEVPGRMSSTAGLLVYSIRVSYFQFNLTALDPTTRVVGVFPQPLPSVTNLMILQNALTLSFFVDHKPKQRAPIGYFNPGFGVYSSFGKHVNGAGGVTSVGAAGIPSTGAVRRNQIPVHVGGQSTFRVEVANPDATAVPLVLAEDASPANAATLMMTVRILLDGLYKRPVS